MSYEIFNNYKNILEKKTSGFSVKYKDQSLFMKILGKLMFFNKTFMTNYTTTIGKTVYFANEEKIKSTSTLRHVSTLAHEYKHVKDYEKYHLWFIFTYLTPQILALVTLPLMIISIWWSWIAFIIFLVLTLLFLSPLPSYGRKYWELRGHIVSLFVINEINKKRWGDQNVEVRKQILISAANKYNQKFTKADYYFMWPFGVKEILHKKVDKIISGEIKKEDPFLTELEKDLKESGM